MAKQNDYKTVPKGITNAQVEAQHKKDRERAGTQKSHEERQKLSQLTENPLPTETLQEFRKRQGIQEYNPDAGYQQQKNEIATLLQSRKSEIYKDVNQSLSARGLSRSSVASTAVAGANAQLAGEEARATLALLRQREAGRERLYSTNLQAAFGVDQLGISKQNVQIQSLQALLNDQNKQKEFDLRQQEIDASKPSPWTIAGDVVNAVSGVVSAGVDVYDATK